MTILTKEETNKCLADIDIALSQMDALVYENEALKAELTHAQSTIAAMTETAKDANASYIAQHNEIVLLKAMKNKNEI